MKINLLSYEEAQDLALKTRWELVLCESGEQCWCRIIKPETKIEDKDENEIYITPAGSVDKLFAEHIVNLHNESLNNKEPKI